jgi:hypothetical protein
VIALHWLAGALMLELIAHGWIMVHGRLSAATAFDLYQSHKSLGFVVLAAARLFARLARASPAPAATLQWERRLAALVQGALDGSDKSAPFDASTSQLATALAIAVGTRIRAMAGLARGPAI